MNPRPPTEEEIRRAVEATQGAPRTEHGIIIPPHVAKQIEESREAVVQPNRAERRWRAKQEARRRREQAKRARMKPEARAALEAAEKAAREIPDESLPAAIAMVKEMASLPKADRDALYREMGGDDAA